MNHEWFFDDSLTRHLHSHQLMPHLAMIHPTHLKFKRENHWTKLRIFPLPCFSTGWQSSPRRNSTNPQNTRAKGPIMWLPVIVQSGVSFWGRMWYTWYSIQYNIYTSNRCVSILWLLTHFSFGTWCDSVSNDHQIRKCEIHRNTKSNHWDSCWRFIHWVSHVYPSLVSSLDSRFQQVTGRAAWSLGRAMRPRLQILERHVAILGFGDGTTVVTVQTFHGIPGTFFRASAAMWHFRSWRHDSSAKIAGSCCSGNGCHKWSICTFLRQLEPVRLQYIKSGYNWWALPDTTLGELQLLNHDLIP